MRSLFSKLVPMTALAALLGGHARGQACVSVTALPDTIQACRQTSLQLSPTITVAPGGTILSTLWVPTTGLSNNNIPNPIVAVGLTSQTYRLTVQAVGSTMTTNGDFTAGNTGFTSGYGPPTGGAFGPLSTDGQYLVTFNANLAHNNFANFTDHTGGGQMMVVNGSTVAGTSVWCQTFAVTPNTNYVFGGWGASAVASSPAVLQFSANGTNVGPATTLPTATGVWTPFGGNWNSGTATSVTVCITNTNTAPSGNDFAIDDINVQPFCTAQDSVHIRVINPATSFASSIRWGCTDDTVDFTATNTGSDTPTSYLWSFGDGATSTQKNPSHIYATQGVYTVKLVVFAGSCGDSVQAQIDLQHPLTASFTQSADSFCQGGSVTFTNTSQTTIRNGIAPKYFWTFGDGGTDTVASPTHVFTQAGVWPVLLTVTDFVPCVDTASSVVVIDSIPFARVTLSDTSLCMGQAVTFAADYLALNNTGVTWDFGDGTGISDTIVKSVRHGYDQPGIYTVTLTASYRICPDTTVTRALEIRPFPRINLGPDTSICPGGEPLLIRARAADGIVRWSTGDTAASILVRHEGDYWAVSDLNGCTAADSVHIAKDCYLDLPNSFTPNGDGVNEYFWPRQLLSQGITSFHMTIFNRWGQKIWETTNIDGRGWDGRFNSEMQPTGVYIYQVEAELKNGFRERYQGNVTLLR